MTNPNSIVLYVSDTLKSRAFYSNLFQREPVQSSDSFSGFAFDSGLFIGLWARPKVVPTVSAPAGASEIGFGMADPKAVDALYADWTKRGVTVAQEPTDMEFGRTFTALDPDGHRLRVFAEAPQ
jgi:predicted enzyme related to lactoylglutathione lyase